MAMKKAAKGWWVVLFNKADRAFVVNVVFESSKACEAVWAAVARGYGWKRTEAVSASSYTEAKQLARAKSSGPLLERVPRPVVA